MTVPVHFKMQSWGVTHRKEILSMSCWQLTLKTEFTMLETMKRSMTMQNMRDIREPGSRRHGGTWLSVRTWQVCSLSLVFDGPVYIHKGLWSIIWNKHCNYSRVIVRYTSQWSYCFGLAQIAKTIGSMSVICRSNAKVQDRYLNEVDPRVFAIRVVAHHIPFSDGTFSMMTSSNGNVFRVTGPLLCGEFTGHRWVPLTKASDAELWCFLWSAPE